MGLRTLYYDVPFFFFNSIVYVIFKDNRLCLFLISPNRSTRFILVFWEIFTFYLRFLFGLTTLNSSCVRWQQPKLLSPSLDTHFLTTVELPPTTQRSWLSFVWRQPIHESTTIKQYRWTHLSLSKAMVFTLGRHGLWIFTLPSIPWPTTPPTLSKIHEWFLVLFWLFVVVFIKSKRATECHFTFLSLFLTSSLIIRFS